MLDFNYICNNKKKNLFFNFSDGFNVIFRKGKQSSRLKRPSISLLFLQFFELC